MDMLFLFVDVWLPVLSFIPYSLCRDECHVVLRVKCQDQFSCEILPKISDTSVETKLEILADNRLYQVMLSFALLIQKHPLQITS
jgi:hypothetical protein